MKLICYILLILLIPAIPVGAQTLSGGQVQVSNQSILISDNGQVMIGMDITLPTAMELSSNCVATLTPVLKTQDHRITVITGFCLLFGYMGVSVPSCNSVNAVFRRMHIPFFVVRMERNRL